MYPLRRRYRHVVASLVAVAFTVVPTLVVGAWAWRIQRPGHVRDVEVELSRALGFRVELEGVRYPRPSEVTYRGLVLRHEEARGKGYSEILRADEVRLVRGESELTAHASDLRLRGESPRQALGLLATVLERSGGLGVERVHVTAAACEVDLGPKGLAFSFQDLAGELAAGPEGPVLSVSYRLADPGPGTHCELMLARDRSAEPVRTNLTLKTLEGAALPARMLNVFFDADGWLGPEAKVEGILTLTQPATARDWSGEFQGRLLDVDLGTVVADRFPRHRLAGKARVEVSNAKWGPRPGQGPGWVEAKGELVATAGTIGADLVRSLAREMRFRLAPRMARHDPRRGDVEFRGLGLAFDMRPDGDIVLGGALGAEFPDGAVLAAAGSPLLLAPDGTSTVHGLIKALFPVNASEPGILVPLTAESQVLLSLPVAPTIGARTGKALGAN